uniref:Uncharacterized protein n=1 Tax=Rhizophora mucronata TaxID=61149 RepID=A0A2P2QSA5_RHIMU
MCDSVIRMMHDNTRYALFHKLF